MTRIFSRACCISQAPQPVWQWLIGKICQASLNFRDQFSYIKIENFSLDMFRREVESLVLGNGKHRK